MTANRKSKPKRESRTQVRDKECENLKLRVKQLEEELALISQSLAKIQAEHDTYRRSLHAQVLTQFSDEDLRRFAEEEDEGQCKPLDQFIGELEKIVGTFYFPFARQKSKSHPSSA